MEKFKNFVYDKSDLLVALLIIALAGLVIWFGINNIMKPYAGSTDTKANTEATDQDAGLAGSATIGNDEDPGEDAGETPTDTPSESFKIIIQQNESSEQIADKLIAVGAIESKAVFYAKLEEMGLAARLQTGSFEIPAGASLEDVIRILTKTN